MQVGHADDLLTLICLFDVRDFSILGATTDLYKYSPYAVPLIHAVSYHVATDKPPRPRWRQVPVHF